MHVLDEEQLSYIFEEIAKGFEKSPVEIALFAALVVGIGLSVVLLYRRQLRRGREEIIKRSQKIFAQTAKKKSLGRADLNILEQMVKHLKSPLDKHLLLEDQPTFNGCARKLFTTDRVAASGIAALRVKLGFKTRSPEGIPHSTAELQDDLPVIIIQKGKKGGRGRITQVKPTSLTIALEGDLAPPIRTLPIQVYFQGPSGRYTFISRIRGYGKGEIEVAHSENIKRMQRRKFYRKKLMLPVYVKRAESDERSILTTLIDLSGGGASIMNRDMLFSSGDRISISLVASRTKRVYITGDVLRMSRGGKIIHVEFSDMLESSRDRIIKVLFMPEKKVKTQIMPPGS
jgi:c-di-GMP-binding flagellar brake protein YcgR